MKLSELMSKTGYTVVCEGNSGAEIKAGYAGDLLSDVMANAAADSVLITIQAHKNTIAVATLAGIRAIVLCNDRSAPDDMVAAASAEKVAVYSTKKNQFYVSAEIAPFLEN